MIQQNPSGGHGYPKTGEQHDRNKSATGSKASGKWENGGRVSGFHITLVDLPDHPLWDAALELLCFHVKLGQYGTGLYL
jgi:hypothetical protein